MKNKTLFLLACPHFIVWIHAIANVSALTALDKPKKCAFE